MRRRLSDPPDRIALSPHCPQPGPNIEGHAWSAVGKGEWARAGFGQGPLNCNWHSRTPTQAHDHHSGSRSPLRRRFPRPARVPTGASGFGNCRRVAAVKPAPAVAAELARVGATVFSRRAPQRRLRCRGVDCGGGCSAATARGGVTAEIGRGHRLGISPRATATAGGPPPPGPPLPEDRHPDDRHPKCRPNTSPPRHGCLRYPGS